ncbi:dihydrofolate reductase family protein [Sphaerisporangium sp. TRM90804]|uniref:dihydrofolate reductase family protein n=1 Tax=Sphaerisporangium sp. TRM90804 TaxID=3031113 RepID=UPI002446D1EA|nr:dihydrofolate reductase family protein [Sphaerisporangium sp. TRM90804]MDH2427008.1 dihydrofolate reductase family protein [Sphaerisporangium sp. TRM90804]
MALIEADISMSVDGYITGPGVDERPGLGDDGEILHAWLGHEEGQKLLAATFAATGAVITSRKVYDDTGGWGEDGFFHKPVFVVTHRAHEPVVKGDTTFTFVTGGIEEAVARAAEAAGDKRVHIMGGAGVIQQALGAGLVDELRLHVAPIVLTSGTSLFDQLGTALKLDPLTTVTTPDATHLTYRIVR